MMKRLVGLLVLGAVVIPGQPAIAEPEWVEIATNAVGDRFLVDLNSIETRDNSVWYWEYRSFEQPNNAFVEEAVEGDVYAVMLYQSVDCRANIARLRQMLVYGSDRQELERFNYGSTGSLSQPVAGSSASRVVNSVCARRERPELTTP